MLKVLRIEVEESTAEAAVVAMDRYEHAIQVTEAERWGIEYPTRPDHPDAEGLRKAIAKGAEHGLPPEQIRESLDDLAQAVHGLPTWLPWAEGPVGRSYFNAQLGRKIITEVIEFDDGLPGYKARRVVEYTRADRGKRELGVDDYTPQGLHVSGPAVVKPQSSGAQA